LPSTNQSVLNNNAVIYTLAVKDPRTGNPVGAGNIISIGVQTAVTRGTASISTVNGTTAVDQSTNANATAGTQLQTVPTDANGNATFTVNGSGSTVTPEVWLEGTTFSGNADTTLDASEFQAVCGSVTFANVSTVTLTVSSAAASSMAQGAQRVYTVTAVDASGLPAATEVNVGFVEALLTIQGTSAVVVWYDITCPSGTSPCPTSTITAQRSTPVTAPDRASTCDQVPNNVWRTDTRVQNTTGATITESSPPQKTFFTLPATGRATFAVCSAIVDSFTPLAFQDVENPPDRLPQNGESQAQGQATTTTASVLTSGAVIGQTGQTNAEINPTSTSDAQAQTKNGSGLEQFNFYMRNQSANGFFTTNSQTVLWTVQNTGGSNIYIVDFDGSATATPITVAPGQQVQVQSPIVASTSGCQSTGVDANTAGSPTLTCHNSARIWLNAAGSTTANITGTLISGGASGTATKQWVAATAEPTGAFQATGTVVAFNTTQKFYMLRTTAGTFVQIFYATHTTDAYVVLGTSTDRPTFESFLKVGDTIEYTNTGSPGGGGQNAGTATHKITAVPSS
jgi:hypothetical protein